MMPNREPHREANPTRLGWSIVGLLILMLLIAGAAFSRQGNPGGPWINAALSEGCPNGQVCAEWPFSDGSAKICCIQSQDMGSNDIGACVTHVADRDPDGIYF